MGALGPSLEGLGRLFGRLAGILGCSWGLLGSLWTVFWGRYGSFGGRFGVRFVDSIHRFDSMMRFVDSIR